jgi:hypothetical protein
MSIAEENIRHSMNKDNLETNIYLRILKSHGKIIDDNTSINSVCWCNCKGKGQIEHGWSMSGGPFK